MELDPKPNADEPTTQQMGDDSEAAMGDETSPNAGMEDENLPPAPEPDVILPQKAEEQLRRRQIQLLPD